jgi:hypothetical protein
MLACDGGASGIQTVSDFLPIFCSYGTMPGIGERNALTSECFPYDGWTKHRKWQLRTILMPRGSQTKASKNAKLSIQ